MYGHVHLCIQEYVKELYGEETWQKVLTCSGCREFEDFLMFTNYDEDLTTSLTMAVVQVCEIELNDLLEAMGVVFFNRSVRSGYDKMMRTLGGDIVSFIQNLDHLHETLEYTYEGFDAPSFRCEVIDESHLELHYYSNRKNLYPIVIDKGEHVTFDVHIDEDEMNPREYQKHASFQSSAALLFDQTTNLDDLFSIGDFSTLCPYHIAFNKELVILSCGEIISQFAQKVTVNEYKLSDIVNLLYPRIPFEFNLFMEYANSKYILELKTSNPAKMNISLKGSMVYLKSHSNIIFMGSPLLRNLDDLMAKKLYLSDIPKYDATRELILLCQQRQTELQISRKLDEATSQLKKVAKALEIEKKKTDSLLYQMLPVKVANVLREGKNVEAEKFSDTTILFSDIVGFTTISSTVQPMQIVSLLNQLYSLFDELTSKYAVYKVETIGDAYMVVAGVPDYCSDHAERIANVSLDMLEKAKQVLSPASREPIQVRLGIHSGPVVAGVVGHKMPRYCLFGDTVNTSSRMESHGLPDKIHCSYVTFSKLTGDYNFEERGEIHVKGKGLMETFFLLSESNGRLTLSPKQIENNSLTEIDNESYEPPDKCSKTTVKQRNTTTNICQIL